MKTRTKVKTNANPAPAPSFSSVLAELVGAFETRKRNDGTPFVVIRDDAPAWTRNDGYDKGKGGPCLMLRLHQAIDDRGPDDWVYASIANLAGRLSEYCDEDTTAEGLRDDGICSRVADAAVDVYNSDLTKWLSLHLGNIDLCNEAVEELGIGTAGGVLGHIQAGQYRALEALAQGIVSEVEKELAARNGGASK